MTDMLFRIAIHLDTSDVQTLITTCFEASNLYHDSIFWKLWCIRHDIYLYPDERNTLGYITAFRYISTRQKFGSNINYITPSDNPDHEFIIRFLWRRNILQSEANLINMGKNKIKIPDTITNRIQVIWLVGVMRGNHIDLFKEETRKIMEGTKIRGGHEFGSVVLLHLFDEYSRLKKKYNWEDKMSKEMFDYASNLTFNASLYQNDVHSYIFLAIQTGQIDLFAEYKGTRNIDPSFFKYLIELENEDIVKACNWDEILGKQHYVYAIMEILRDCRATPTALSLISQSKLCSGDLKNYIRSYLLGYHGKYIMNKDPGWIEGAIAARHERINKIPILYLISERSDQYRLYMKVFDTYENTKIQAGCVIQLLINKSYICKINKGRLVRLFDIYFDKYLVDTIISDDDYMMKAYIIKNGNHETVKYMLSKTEISTREYLLSGIDPDLLEYYKS